jgi:hypothetical protein
MSEHEKKSNGSQMSSLPTNRKPQSSTFTFLLCCRCHQK